MKNAQKALKLPTKVPSVLDTLNNFHPGTCRGGRDYQFVFFLFFEGHPRASKEKMTWDTWFLGVFLCLCWCKDFLFCLMDNPDKKGDN